MKPEHYKKLEEKLKKSDDVKIKLMTVYPVPQHQVTQEDMKEVDWSRIVPSKNGSTVLKELEFKTAAYPSIEITDLDMCSDMDETVDLTMKFTFYISKKKLFELMCALHSSDTLWYDENFPLTVKLTVKPDIDGFHWKKDESTKCEKCNGTGMLIMDDGDHTHDMECDGCNGTGLKEN